MPPEERLSLAIDQILADADPPALRGEEAALLALAAGLRAASLALVPPDTAAMRERLLRGFSVAAKTPAWRGGGLGAAAAAILCAVVLGQPGKSLQPQARWFTQTKAAKVIVHASTAAASAQIPATSFATSTGGAPTAAPFAPVHTNTFAESTVVTAPVNPPKIFPARYASLGMLAVQIPPGIAPTERSAVLSSLVGTAYHVGLRMVGDAAGGHLALLETSGLPSGWYRAAIGRYHAMVYLARPGQIPLLGRHLVAAAAGTKGPRLLAVDFQATQTRAIFDATTLMGWRNIRMIGPNGPEAPAWAVQQMSGGTQAVVLVFDPTAAGTKAIAFRIPGHWTVRVVLP